MFEFAEIMFPVMFTLVFLVIIVTIVRNIGTWSKNNHSPRLIVPAKIVGKREDVTWHHHANAGDMSGAQGYHSTSSTNYYITFQVESGDRLELSVPGSEYGLLIEGDEGKLTFQGTRYLSFEREG